MKKTKLILLLSALSITTVLVGCQTSTNTEPNNVESNLIKEEVKEEAEQDIIDNVEKETNEDTKEDISERDTEKPKTAPKEYSISDIDDNIINNDEEDILDLLGEPTKRSTYELFDDSYGTQLVYKDLNTVVDISYANTVYDLKTSSNKFNHVRGIKIGDSVKDVMAKFPNKLKGSTKKHSFDDISIKEDYSLLYGEYLHRADYGMITYDKRTDAIKRLIYSDESTLVEFNFEKDILKSITYVQSLT